MSLDVSQKVLLANRHSHVTQNGVRRGLVKVKVRQRKRQNVALPREAQLPGPGLDLDLHIQLAVHAAGFHLLQHLERLCNPGLQVVERCLVVFHRHGFGLGDAHRDALGRVAHALDLVGEGLHVGDEACLGELREGHALFFGIGFGLLENPCCVFKALDEGGDGNIIE